MIRIFSSIFLTAIFLLSLECLIPSGNYLPLGMFGASCLFFGVLLVSALTAPR